MSTRPTRLVAKSKTVMSQIVLPNHTNALGTAFGGVIVSWIDIAAAIAGQRFCGETVVTASIDALHFLTPAKLGQIVNLVAQVNYAGQTSMEIGVCVETENPRTNYRAYTAKAYLTFVAIDSNGTPLIVPQAIAETETERRRYQSAQIRREARLELAAALKAVEGRSVSSAESRVE